jgi:hypothetical protein
MIAIHTPRIKRFSPKRKKLSMVKSSTKEAKLKARRDERKTALFSSLFIKKKGTIKRVIGMIE